MTTPNTSSDPIASTDTQNPTTPPRSSIVKRAVSQFEQPSTPAGDKAGSSTTQYPSVVQQQIPPTDTPVTQPENEDSEESEDEESEDQEEVHDNPHQINESPIRSPPVEQDNQSLPSPTSSDHLPPNLPPQEVVLSLIDHLSSPRQHHQRHSSLTRFPVKPSTPIMANTPAPPSNALVLYNPQDFDTVMTNGSDLVLSGISVEDPPEWVIELHTKMQESHHALVTLARTVKKDQLQSLAIREQYATMCATYQAMTNMYRIHMQVSDEQITLFKRQIEEASSNFSQQVWSTVAKFSQDNKEKARAIDKLQEVANHHHRALEVLQRELQQQQTFQHNVSNWAMEKDLQINDLLAREFVNPEQMN
ncbi:hypothetical protein F4779DRAFT_322077, partial [Xylariaceae sp. FL0662B]